MQFVSVNAGGPSFYSTKMQKDPKSLAALVLFLALCVAVQRSDSAVSAFLVFLADPNPKIDSNA